MSNAYYLDGPSGELERVQPNLFQQAAQIPASSFFLVCDCGAMVPFDAGCAGCSPPPVPARPSFWRRLINRFRKETP